MNKKLINVLFIACLSFVFAISLSYAQDKGKDQKKIDHPAGIKEKKKAGNLIFLRDKTKRMESKRGKEINLKIIGGKNLNPKVSKK